MLLSRGANGAQLAFQRLAHHNVPPRGRGVGITMQAMHVFDRRQTPGQSRRRQSRSVGDEKGNRGGICRQSSEAVRCVPTLEVISGRGVLALSGFRAGIGDKGLGLIDERLKTRRLRGKWMKFMIPVKTLSSADWRGPTARRAKTMHVAWR